MRSKAFYQKIILSLIRQREANYDNWRKNGGKYNVELATALGTAIGALVEIKRKSVLCENRDCAFNTRMFCRFPERCGKRND